MLETSKCQALLRFKSLIGSVAKGTLLESAFAVGSLICSLAKMGVIDNPGFIADLFDLENPCVVQIKASYTKV